MIFYCYQQEDLTLLITNEPQPLPIIGIQSEKEKCYEISKNFVLSNQKSSSKTGFGIVIEQVGNVLKCAPMFNEECIDNIDKDVLNDVYKNLPYVLVTANDNTQFINKFNKNKPICRTISWDLRTMTKK